MKKIISQSIILASALLLLVSLSTCSKTSTPGPNQVYMQSTSFNPSSITVPVNTTVTWTNQDNITHNVTSTTGLFASPTISPSGTYTHQFTTTGTYPYSCTIHPGMNGVVIVQ